MKKIFRLLLSTALIVSFMTVTQSVNAGNIDKATARQVGAYFMASQFGDKAITATSLKEVYQYPNVELGIPALYVFNTPGNRGFVIISGTDCVSPVVAYSTDGAFDPTNIAPNLNWWLTDQAQPIIYAQNNNLEPLNESLAEWETLIQERLPYFGQDSKEIIRLTTSTWNQEPLYNNLCPIDNGGRCVTGCVATAMAQIMYYWQYPWVGKSVHGYYWYKNGTTATYLEANFGQTYYDYNNMVDALSTSSTQEQINACALLSYHCGVAVDMNYSSEASGSHDEKAKLAFYKYFKYNQDSIKLLDRSAARYRNDNNQTNPNYKDTLWVNDLKEHIMKKDKNVLFIIPDMTSVEELTLDMLLSATVITPPPRRCISTGVGAVPATAGAMSSSLTSTLCLAIISPPATLPSLVSHLLPTASVSAAKAS